MDSAKTVENSCCYIVRIAYDAPMETNTFYIVYCDGNKYSTVDTLEEAEKVVEGYYEGSEYEEGREKQYDYGYGKVVASYSYAEAAQGGHLDILEVA